MSQTPKTPCQWSRQGLPNTDNLRPRDSIPDSSSNILLLPSFIGARNQSSRSRSASSWAEHRGELWHLYLLKFWPFNFSPWAQLLRRVEACIIPGLLWVSPGCVMTATISTGEDKMLGSILSIWSYSWNITGTSSKHALNIIETPLKNSWTNLETSLNPPW